MRRGVTGDTQGVAYLDTAREPNFFELLKASINAGSKARAFHLNTGTLAASDVQAQQDVSFDYAIMQIGANMIAQSRVDGFGICIRFNDGVLPMKEFHGVVDNPYLYRARWGVLKIRNENPVFTGSLPIPNAAAGTVPANDGKWQASQGLLVDPGVTMVMLIPEIWNPHDENMPQLDAALRPSKFRIVVDSADPDTVLNGGVYNQVTAKGTDSRSPGNPSSTDRSEATGSFGQPPFSRQKGGVGPEITGSYKGYLHSLQADTTAMTFDIPNRTLFREPTLLARYGVPSGSNLKIDSTKWVADEAPAVDYLNLETSSGKSFTAERGFKADVKNPLVLPDANTVSASTEYVGFPFGLFPSQWLRYRSSGEPTATRMIARSDLAGPSGDTNVTIRLQYQDPTNEENWITYDTKYLRPNSAWAHNILGQNGAGGLLQGVNTWATYMDPRSSRFGALTPVSGSSITDKYNAPGAAKRTNNGSRTTYSYAEPETQPANAKEWLDAANNVLTTNRPQHNTGFNFDVLAASMTPGWYPLPTGTNYALRTGLFSQNSSDVTNDNLKYSGVFGTDPYPTGSAPSANYYLDADNVQRRAMGGYATGTTQTGLPLSTTRHPGNSVVSNQSQSRPWILHRPFRSVAELGYVFSGTPWKHLDFFTPESGDTALLDVFCINESYNSEALVAGRVNLNARRPLILKTLLANAYTNEGLPAASTLNGDTNGVAEKIANALVDRISGSSTGNDPKPLVNTAELVGKWNGTTNAAPIIGSSTYDGFSKDLTDILNTAYGANSSMTNIQRFREAAVRPLASMGTTRVWNLMIDVVVQSGRFPPSADSMEKFSVEGEQRCWVHIAIDRLTGRVIDKHFEMVIE